MKMPKHVEDLIVKRAKAAATFNESDMELSKWLDEHGVETESCDTHGGVDSIANPWESANRVMNAIKNA